MITVREDVGVDMILDSISISTLSIYFGNLIFLILKGSIEFDIMEAPSHVLV